MHVLLKILLITTVIVPSASVVAAVPLEESLTLDQAVEAALRLSPSLRAAMYSVSAAEARTTQAGLFPNPEFSLETENFGGSGNLDGFDAAETTAVISQEILLGGKTRRGRAVAQSDQILAGRNLEAARLDIVSNTTLQYYRVLTAQEREAMAEELLALADRFAHTVRARVDAGKVSPVEGTRADIEVAQSRIRWTRAVRDLKAARVRLAATWGSRAPTFGRAVGELPEPKAPPSLEDLRSLLLQTPEILRLEGMTQRQQNVLDVESAFRIPDLTVSLGPRRFSETGQSAWVAGISLPIPIFDRNQGSRAAAEFELERVRCDAEAVRVAVEADLAAGLERLQAAELETKIMNDQVVPAAEAAFAATEKGYTEGKFGFLDVLDAQRALFKSRSLLLDSREEYALTLTEIERLVGVTPGTRLRAATGGSQLSQGEE
jgi:cobalt-zinc-cadmium efflux system outer membrane protein